MRSSNPATAHRCLFHDATARRVRVSTDPLRREPLGETHLPSRVLFYQFILLYVPR